MRRIGANYIITNTEKTLKNSYLELTDEGIITNIVDTNGSLKEVAGLEFHNGILVPGFVNAHTHLELSYLKGQIEEQKGLPHFIKSIRHLRLKTTLEERLESIQKGDLEMQKEGIVLVGDIANSTETIETKLKSPIHYYTFAETFGIEPQRADNMFKLALSNLQAFKDAKLDAGIVPHATYSISKKLFQLLHQYLSMHKSIISIHNQETESENEMFISKTGALLDGFIKGGMDLSQWKPTGENALISVLKQLPKEQNINLVHNTFTEQKDIDEAQRYNPQLFWTLCPAANLYIENRLANIPLLFDNKLNICLGTDSLASNKRLSILEEMIIIQSHFSEIPFEKLILASSLNGAKMLYQSEKFGSFEKGKQPGVVLIQNFDFNRFQLKTNSSVKKLI